MNNKNLQIGNYVGATIAGNQVGYEFKNDFERVCYQENGFVPIKIETGTDIDTAAKWYFDIPLTENILIHLGFTTVKTYPNHYIYKNIDLFMDDEGNASLDDIALNSLHQLQNLVNFKEPSTLLEIIKNIKE